MPRDHIIPQFYLRHFSQEFVVNKPNITNNMFTTIQYDKHKKNTHNIYVKDVLQKTNYYDDALDSILLDKFESKFAPFLKKIHDAETALFNNLNIISHNQQLKIDFSFLPLKEIVEFMFSMIARTNRFRTQLMTDFKKMEIIYQNSSQEQKHFIDALGFIRGEKSKRDIDIIIKKILDDDHMLGAFTNFKITFIINLSPRYFITSDNPVSYNNLYLYPNRFEDITNRELTSVYIVTSQHAVLFFPLTPRTGIMFQNFQTPKINDTTDLNRKCSFNLERLFYYIIPPKPGIIASDNPRVQFDDFYKSWDFIGMMNETVYNFAERYLILPCVETIDKFQSKLDNNPIKVMGFEEIFRQLFKK